MKKVFVAAALFFSLGLMSAKAGDETVTPKVLESFKNEFSSATNVTWEKGNNFYRAAFAINGQNVFAYYKTDGELISVARYISSLQLPFNLLNNLKNDYEQYWISDLFEVSNSEGTHYYVTLENAETKLMLKADNGNNWTTRSKTKKV